MIRQEVSTILSLEAGAVADGDYTMFVCSHLRNHVNFQILWTAGLGGTLSVKLYGSMADCKLADVSGLDFEDVTQKIYNVDAFTGDSLLLSNDGYLGLLSWVKVVASVGGSDPTTALTIWCKSKE